MRLGGATRAIHPLIGLPRKVQVEVLEEAKVSGLQVATIVRRRTKPAEEPTRFNPVEDATQLARYLALELDQAPARIKEIVARYLKNEKQSAKKPGAVARA
jgi:hypothetical protein